jgi:hypothetical protein
MTDILIEATEFNCENIKYSSPKANSAGGKAVNIYNKLTNSRLNISTPMILTWGASDFVDPKTGEGNGKYEMTLQFPTDEFNNENLRKFLDNMKAFEEKIKSDALKNSKDWFGKVHKSSEVVDALYTPMLKYSKDKNTGEFNYSKPPSIRVKIPIWEGVWKCEVYNDDGVCLFPNDKNITPITLIPKATNIKVLMTCGGIWFANGKFGVTWKLIQAMVQKPKPQLSGKCFLKTQVKDETPISSTPDTPPVSPPVSQPPVVMALTTPLVNEIEMNVAIEDSDCDDDDDLSVTAASINTEVVTQNIVVASEPTKKPRKIVKKKGSE